MTTQTFTIELPEFDAQHGVARFGYRLGELQFSESLTFPEGTNPARAESAAFKKLLNLTACVLGVSYYKLLAPFEISATGFTLTNDDIAFVRDVYENGLGEFYARNQLQRFGRLEFAIDIDDQVPEKIDLAPHTLLPIGGGKDSLVSVQLLENARIDFTPFAVNPKGPILSSVERIGKSPLYVARVLDPEMIRLGQQPGFYNGHVPSTAINSMIAALTALLFGYNRIMLSNERSASEGNMQFDGREANHQHSKSLDFERLIAVTLANSTGGALEYFSLLRPYSEAGIARIFARETRFDDVFSSCNRNFKLSGHDGPLWCGECPKCHFTFLILASVMPATRVVSIFGQNLLAKPENEHAYRELTGLAGQKPWECVGEILEAAACLWVLGQNPEWQDAVLVQKLLPDLKTQYGVEALEAAYAALQIPSHEHLVPLDLTAEMVDHAV